MAPLRRTLLALACAALLHSATCHKTKCVNTTIGIPPSPFPPPMVFHVNFNQTGTYDTVLNIDNVCRSWDSHSKLLYEEVTVCNDDGWTLKIDEHKSFSSIEVHCLIHLFDVDWPCLFWDINMDVKVTQYCTGPWPIPHSAPLAPPAPVNRG